MKHSAKLVSIVTEKVFEVEIIRLLEKAGVKGYTIFEGGGSGSFHHHHDNISPMIDGFRIVKIETIMSDATLAEQIAMSLVEEFFSEKPGVVSLSDVEVFRNQKF
ncbi:P-II family nitrogen regulator [Salinibius halmophilus]|uniref:P-II family nitrogen regulator n=1 Tax=Salinibius halmophilus TaxID=1853216 RepID=UPI000E66FA2A|nr:hypothetical protein [Salinibius halmophilus]